jgi:hypothetical protein
MEGSDMNRLRTAALAATMLLLAAVPATSATPPALHGVLAPSARVGGQTVGDFAGDFDVWFLSNADDNPTLNPRCEPSPLDPRVWYLPVSLGGDPVVDCDIPLGSFLLLMTGSAECSNLEAEPWYGADEAGLIDCVDTMAEGMTDTSATIDGATTHDLARYLVRSDVVDMPANNLLSPDAGISMIKGYFLLIAPLAAGEHTLNGWVAFGDDFAGGVTYHLTVR